MPGWVAQERGKRAGNGHDGNVLAYRVSTLDNPKAGKTNSEQRIIGTRQKTRRDAEAGRV